MIIPRAFIWSWFLQWASVSTQVRGCNESALRDVWVCILCVPGRGEEGRTNWKDWNAWKIIKYPSETSRNRKGEGSLKYLSIEQNVDLMRLSERRLKPRWLCSFSPRMSSSAGRENQEAVCTKFSWALGIKLDSTVGKSSAFEGSIATFKWLIQLCAT